MATKLDSTCLQNTADNEPIFVLRAQDKLAAATIGHWCGLAMQHGVPIEKIEKAMVLAGEMTKWQNRKIPD
jgi:hypothetical protein